MGSANAFRSSREYFSTAESLSFFWMEDAWFFVFLHRSCHLQEASRAFSSFVLIPFCGCYQCCHHTSTLMMMLLLKKGFVFWLMMMILGDRWFSNTIFYLKKKIEKLAKSRIPPAYAGKEKGRRRFSIFHFSAIQTFFKLQTDGFYCCSSMVTLIGIRERKFSYEQRG